jgi:hypothetical protein
VRCPNYALEGESRCQDCKTKFEAARRANPHLTGRRGTTRGWRRLRGLAIHNAKHRCQRCGLHEDVLHAGGRWLEGHHKDGNANNNRLSNIEVLCNDPCHKEAQREV